MTWSSFAQNSTFQAPAPQAALRKAQKAFIDTKYNTAIKEYRKYLRKNRKDGDVWSQLAVCFYYTGEPKKALEYLKKWEDRSHTKSYNQYHQGLIYESLGMTQKARAPLIRAARNVDEYAARAIFELAILEYKAKDNIKATYWIRLYKQRFPQGGFMPQIIRLEQLIANGIYLESVGGNKRPDPEESLFKYNELSLSKLPHFWFYKIGYSYFFGDVVQPSRDGNSPTGTKVENYSVHDLVVHSGIGIGPVKQGDFSSTFAYLYLQDWFADQERLDNYLSGSSSELTDYITYLPFRPDLMQRTHRLLGNFSYNGPVGLYGGALVRQDFSFMGSSLIPGPEGDDIDQHSTQLGSGNLLLPYFGLKYLDNSETNFYLLFRKEIIKDASEYSNKTYDFGGSEPVISYGLSHRSYFPESKLELKGEIFQYEYIYNDYWLDFTRLGGVFGLEYEIEEKTNAQLMFGYYDDQYQLAILTQGACKGPSSGESGTEVKTCTHRDTGYVIQAGATYDWTQFTRLGFLFTMIENQDPQLPVFERTDQVLEFTVTTAFPNNRRVAPYIKRFGEEVFSKKVD